MEFPLLIIKYVINSQGGEGAISLLQRTLLYSQAMPKAYW